ncbi:hypothetical protein NHX12_014715 [Muraenolepis orangiensis]|uniref:Cyclodeaminase/cyclohydrolase domain-containing protein n=1 Tax=Muraenolepis orangiensis TaxID=630683 RepID=A0A9Q0D960_9TELE|nr:hypothetical protein NHX12_014715 [Muraenolepis orangiensis]
MVGQMTYGKRQFEGLDGAMRKLIPPFHQAVEDLLLLVDADSSAFNSYMAALKLPKTTEEDTQRRQTAMQAGLREAVAVPLSLAERVSTLWDPLLQLVLQGNISCLSDVQVSAKALETAVFGAYFNVIINLKDVSDQTFKTATQKRASELLQQAKEKCSAVLDHAEKRT